MFDRILSKKQNTQCFVKFWPALADKMVKTQRFFAIFIIGA